MAGMTETYRHMEAFEYYYSLGLDRSYAKVANHFNVSVQSVERWGKSFKWRDRVTARDLDAGQKLRERNETTILDEKEQYRRIIKASLASYVAELKAGKIKVTKVNDVINLIELDLKILGMDGDKNTNDETKNTILQLVDSIKGLKETSDGRADDKES